MHVERAEGGRQDLEYDAAVSMYVNRKYAVEYLAQRVHAPGHANKLEDFLYQSHLTTEYLAMMRANAIIDLRISRPLRWLCGKGSELVDWSPFSMGLVLEKLEALFERVARSGMILFDPALDIWKDISDARPKFREYLEHMFEKETVLSPDGKTKHLLYKMALAELLDPADETNRRTRSLTVEYLQVQP